jgi:DNA-binding NtrC family response regulator
MIMHSSAAPSAIVLIADDDEDTRSFLHLALESEKYRVVVATDGEEAIKLFDEYTPQVVVTDLSMPRASGLDVVRHVRESGSHAPIILVTAHGSKLASHALEAGASEVLAKPVDLERLFQSVARLLVQTDAAR